MLQLSGINKHFGGLHAVKDLNLRCVEGTVTGLIGPNGAGKTTLFDLLCGSLVPESGQMYLGRRNISRASTHQRARMGIVRTFQHGRVFANLSVLDNLLAIAKIKPDAAMGVLELFGERLAPRWNDPAYSLSYANRRRLEIARALATRPRILLLDEPCAGMNPGETAEMLQFFQELKAQGQTMVLVEHKLSLVFPLANEVVVMDEGAIIARGLPELVRHDPVVLEAYLGRKAGT